MKIAYLAELTLENQGGVIGKIFNQVKIWRKLGHEVKIFIRAYTNGEYKFPEYCNVYSGIPNRRPEKPNLIKGLLNKCLTHRKIAKDVIDFNPDIIYYRYKIWYPFLIKDILSFTSYFVELNTDDIKETKLKGAFRYWYNKITRKLLLSNAAGLVCVTEEIAERNKKLSRPTCVIGNGYDLSSVTPIPAPCNIKPQIIFVGGGGNALWHGVDKIIVMANNLQEFTFHVVGPPRSQFSSYKSLPKNIYFHGYMTKEQLTNLYKIVDVAIGTLALHRNQMEEASPLKVREYLAYGIPVIIGYKDTDLKDENPAILRLPNRETNVVENIDTIREFVYKQIGNRVSPASVSMLDYKDKEIKRIHFLEQIANQPQ